MPGTTVSESPSPASASPSSAPTWAPPRAPLPPHRLAKLANALGVSTPLPASHAYNTPSYGPSSAVPASSASSSFSDHFPRSPTPSAASAQTFTASSSSTRFLLHVIPPQHLPHESDAACDADLAPPPPSASGYHAQFRRGVLVPVYPTLSSQLAAIAKEYALPSTVGMVLYLITTAPSPSTSLVSSPSQAADDRFDDPGPRISEDIWRHIWFRVIKAEKDDMMPSGPRAMGLGIHAASESSPSLLQDVMSSSLRPVISPRRAETPQPRQTATPSPSSTTHSAFSSQSELDTPESNTSVSMLGGASDDLSLPGLRSPALIPVLAKVEFDIDRRKAGWYESWLRSRRVNHAKRAAGMRKRAGSRLAEEEGEGSDIEERRAPLDLKIVGRMHAHSGPAFLRPMSPAEESEYEMLPDGEDMEDDTARIAMAAADADPLADVFGTDAETWADVHAEAPRRTRPSPTADLALDADALAALPDKLSDDERESGPSDSEEVAQLWDRHARPSLVVSIPSPPTGTAKRRSSPTTAGTVRRAPPPRLDLAPALPNAEELGVSLSVSPLTTGSSPASSKLPYLADGSPAPSDSSGSTKTADYVGIHVVGDGDELVEEEQVSMRHRKVRSYQEEKREGVFFEDLNLGLEESLEFDESDPHDRRRSQLVMKAQLDEIERNLTQFSPRKLQTDDLAEDKTHHPSLSSATTLSPPSWGRTSRLDEQLDSSPLQSNASLPDENGFYPAVPLSHVNSGENVRAVNSRESLPPSPPRIAFNGVSTEPPRPVLKRARSGTVSDESLVRIREQEEAALYPPLVAPTLFKSGNHAGSPVIPLSPDPFGRFPSAPEASRLDEERRQSVYTDDAAHPGTRSRSSTFRGPSPAHIGHERAPSQTPSSRFSLDSVTSEDGPGGNKALKPVPLVSMKSIKKLWRKTNNKLSMSSSAPQSDSGRSSPHDTLPPRPVSRSPLPDDSMPPPPPPLKSRRKNSVHSMQYNQDTPYPHVPSRTPPPPSSTDSSRQASPMIPYATIPPVPSRTPPLDSSRHASPVPPAATPPLSSSPLPDKEKNPNVRKSILKSWRSANGSLTVQTGALSPSPTPYASGESTPLAPEPPAFMKRRKSSLLDGARRGSLVTASPTLADIPPSPALPDSVAHLPRASLRQSQILGANGNGNAKRASAARPRPSMSSTDSSSSPPRPARLAHAQGAASPPRSGSRLTVSRSSGDSGESRPSLDVSQFEMVSPQKDRFGLESTLSYPYHTLDHSMTSEA